MAPPIVSVITPCYRQGGYLAGTIESVLRQSYPHVEMIVVNDGSDDETADVAGQYAARIRYLAQANMGLAAARNAGISVARGDYFLFLDADDLLHEDAIAWLVGVAAGSSRRLAMIGHRRFTDDPSTGDDRFAGDEPLLPRLFLYNIAPPLAFLAPARLVREVGGFDQRVRALGGCEDWDLWLRLALNGAEGAAVPRVGGYYRQHAAAMSGDSAKMERGRVEVLRRAYRAVRGNPETAARWGQELPRIRQHLAISSWDAGYLAAREGMLGRALNCYGAAAWRGHSLLRVARGVGTAVPHWVASGARRLHARLAPTNAANAKA